MTDEAPALERRWSLIDMSFGVFGAIPLWIVLRMIRRLEALRTEPVAALS